MAWNLAFALRRRRFGFANRERGAYGNGRRGGGERAQGKESRSCLGVGREEGFLVWLPRKTRLAWRDRWEKAEAPFSSLLPCWLSASNHARTCLAVLLGGVKSRHARKRGRRATIYARLLRGSWDSRSCRGPYGKVIEVFWILLPCRLMHRLVLLGFFFPFLPTRQMCNTKMASATDQPAAGSAVIGRSDQEGLVSVWDDAEALRDGCIFPKPLLSVLPTGQWEGRGRLLVLLLCVYAPHVGRRVF